MTQCQNPKLNAQSRGQTGEQSETWRRTKDYKFRVLETHARKKEKNISYPWGGGCLCEHAWLCLTLNTIYIKNITALNILYADKYTRAVNGFINKLDSLQRVSMDCNHDLGAALPTLCRCKVKVRVWIKNTSTLI